ncbi:MAG: MBL fold metallo-hydrolase [Promethearchaeota archaeon]|nr:MAG: MBL fold metallo-hydrolase [Candidatus Lokiarchaeota archaeon]
MIMLDWESLIEDSVFLVKEQSSRVNRLNSLVIHDKGTTYPILIDANYPFDNIDELYSKIEKAKMLLFSHGHLDHTAHAFYHQEKYRTPLFCPVQEKNYLTDLESLMERVGFTKLNLKSTYTMMVREYMKFQECTKVNSFTPGKDNFEFNYFIIETIHIPGHSPGHTAFKIFSKNNITKKILYAADIGSHPYYGDLNSDLTKYRNSIDKLEEIYLNDDYILVPAHGTYYIDKDPEFFNRIRNKIDRNKQRILEALKEKKSLSIRELVNKKVLNPEKRMREPIKDLYYLWDGGMIYQHLQELLNEDRIKKIEHNGFLSNEYVLN